MNDYSKLIQFKQKLEEYEIALQAIESEEKILENIRKRPYTAAADYDALHKDAFIREHAGEEPFLGILHPVQSYVYRQRVKDAKVLYHDLHDESKAVEVRREEEAREYEIRDQQYRIERKKEDASSKRQAVIDDSTLPNSLNNKEAVNALLSYFEYGLAESLKEALNLYRRDKRIADLEKKLELLMSTEEENHRLLIQQERTITALNKRLTALSNQFNAVMEQVKKTSLQVDAATKASKEAFEKANEVFAQIQTTSVVSTSVTAPDKGPTVMNFTNTGNT